MSKHQAQGIFRLLALLYLLQNLVGLAHTTANYFSGKYFYEGPSWIVGGEGKQFLYSALTSYGISIFAALFVMVYSAELAGLVVHAYAKSEPQEQPLDG